LKFIEYIGRMLVLSLILTVIVNLLLLGFRYFPFEIFIEWAWRFELGNTVIIIPWFAMVLLSLGFMLVQYIIRGIRRNN